jgi:SAM-dependent methyltransferase
MPADALPPDSPLVERAKWATHWWLAARSLRMRRWLWRRGATSSAFVHRYLGGLKGIEIGASAHNDYGVDAINVDRFVSDETKYKLDEWNLSGYRRHIDMVARGDDLPFKDSAVDFVLASHVIEHFPDPIKALKEWLRVARKYVLVIVPHRDRTFDHDRDLTPIEEIARRHAEGFTSEEDKHWTVWTCESFLEMCEHFGLRAVAHQDPDDKMGNGFMVLFDASATEPTPRVEADAVTPLSRRSESDPAATPG